MPACILVLDLINQSNQSTMGLTWKTRWESAHPRRGRLARGGRDRHREVRERVESARTHFCERERPHREERKEIRERSRSRERGDGYRRPASPGRYSLSSSRHRNGNPRQGRALCMSDQGDERRAQPGYTRAAPSRSRGLFSATEAPMVTLRHPDEDFAVPEAILMSCSPVLDYILRDTTAEPDEENKILTIDHVRLEELEAFVGMMTMNSYAPTDPTLTSADLAKRPELLMPLIHKYDCKGLLIRLQEAVNLRPEVSSILTILEYEAEADWMEKNALDCLAVHVFPFHRSTRAKEILEGLPPSVLVRLLVHVVEEAMLEDETEAVTVGEKRVVRYNDEH